MHVLTVRAITIIVVCCLLLIGLGAFGIIQKIKKAQTISFTKKFPEAVTIYTSGRNDGGWLKNMEITKVDGRATHFFYNRDIAGIFLLPGVHVLTLKYTRNSIPLISRYRCCPISIIN